MRFILLLLISFSVFSFNSDVHAQSLNDSVANESVITEQDTAYNEEISNDEAEEEINNVYRKIGSDHWKKIKSDKDFIYHKKKTPKIKKKIKQHNFDLSKLFNAGLFKGIIILLATFVVLLIIYLLLKNSDFSYFKKKPSNEVKPTKILDFNNVKEITEWEHLLQEALKRNDFRVAIRIHYLELLQLLDKKGLIKHKSELTNWDYVNQMKSSNYCDSFIKLTKYFDFVWYGTFILTEQKYNALQHEFYQLKEIVK